MVEPTKYLAKENDTRVRRIAHRAILVELLHDIRVNSAGATFSQLIAESLQARGLPNTHATETGAYFLTTLLDRHNTSRFQPDLLSFDPLSAKVHELCGIKSGAASWEAAREAHDRYLSCRGPLGPKSATFGAGSGPE